MAATTPIKTPAETALPSRFDLNLFLKLNAEYQCKPLVPSPRKTDAASLSDQARRRAKNISTRVDVVEKRLLEVGCGRGHLGQELVRQFGTEYVGIDVVDYDTWAELGQLQNVSLAARDISSEDSTDLGQFDVIVSLAVLEHVVHPYAMLKAMFDRLRPGGVAYIAANLHRGPKASHRYRQVYFPWPHLLFSDSVWRAFYQHVYNRDETFSWVNKLTYSEYLVYFDLIGYKQSKVWLTPSTFDVDFYNRFHYELSKYPRFDLSHDFVYAVLQRPEQPAMAASSQRPLHEEIDRLSRELTAMQNSRSWRLTAPMRKLHERLPKRALQS